MQNKTQETYQIHPVQPPTLHPTATTLQNLTLHSLPTPVRTTPGPHSALVRIHAVALNARDTMVVSHSPAYPVSTTPGLTPCSDGAGTIIAVGQDSKWCVGDKVVLHPNAWVDGSDVRDFELDKVFGGGDVQGTLVQWKVVRDEGLVRMPKNLGFEEAACLPTAGGTAVNALFFGPVRVREGMSVLVQGTGGVSVAALQLAVAAGATVIATSSSDEKLHFAKSLGAMHTINYRTTPDWAAQVQRLTSGKGVDHVVDVGGAGTIEQSLQSVRQGGLVSVVGVLSPSKATDLVPALLFSGKIARGVLAFSKPMIEELVRLVEIHDLHPVIAKSFEWKDAKQAFELMLNQTEIGKIVIKV